MADKPNKKLAIKPAEADDQYVKVENDIERIRKATPLYLSPLGTMGALHLLYEIFNNSVDEGIRNHGTGAFSDPRNIFITFSESDRRFTVTDEGRGIPHNEMAGVISTIQYSTKLAHTGVRNKEQTGIYGVGMTVVAAVCDYLSVTSYRGHKTQLEGASKTIEICAGDKAVKELPAKPLKDERHGLSVTMIPSEKYLGPIELTYDIVEDYLRTMSYVLPPYIVTHYYRVDETGKKHNHITYRSEGLGACATHLSTSLEFNPVSIGYSSPSFDIEMAFSYDRTLDDSLTKSFANGAITREGGNHELACQRAICDYFAREAKKLDPTNKFEVLYDDCRKGLIMAIKCNHLNPVLEGNSKSKLSNPDVLKEGKPMMQQALGQYFQSDQALLRKIIAYLRQIAKVRLESKKIKGVSAKKVTTFLDDAEIAKFYGIANRYSKGYKELFISEGDSAIGALDGSRNSEYQAIFALTGVTNNVHSIDIGDLKNKPIFSNLIKILGCGVGTDFDLSKLKYNKILITTDSDIDGHYITSLLLLFFYKFMPELITEGKLYKAMPPLYRLDDASAKRFNKSMKSQFLYDKHEYYEFINRVIVDNIDIVLENLNGDLIPLNRAGAMTWLNDNAEYDLEIKALGKKSAADNELLEHVCYFKVAAKGDEKKFKKLILTRYPEMTYDLDKCALIGSNEGESFSLICDHIFMHNARRYLRVLSQNPSIYIHYKNKNDADDKYKKITIGEFFKQMKRTFNIKIEQRYKGLGEAKAEVLWATTTNPKLRKLFRITINDAKQAAEHFSTIHGKSPQSIAKRRKLLDDMDISFADIDN